MSEKVHFKSEFQESFNKLERFAKHIENRFNNIFKEEEIELGFPLQTRIKTWESIEDKVFVAKRFSVKKTIFEMQDIIGFRIVLLSLSDINKIQKLIEDAFIIVKFYNTAEKLNHDQFGYNSIHMILKDEPSFKNIPGYKTLGDFQFEVQIRTLSQHIWAETSRFFNYKKEAGIPKPLLRSVGRISALLETVDFEIERLIEQRQIYIENISVNESDASLLNIDILEKYLKIHLGEKRYSENPYFDEILEDLKDNDITTTADLNLWWIQVINATPAELFNFSAKTSLGVLNPNLFLGRLFKI
jgi:putative GTP pyrophosphokinase